MKRAVVGWESTSPLPDTSLNKYLNTRNGHLFFEDLDLAALFEKGSRISNLDRDLHSPLEIVYLPMIRQQIRYMCEIFTQAIDKIGYAGAFHYTYASKANAAEEVIRTTLGAGAQHEMSSVMDIEIIRFMMEHGRLDPQTLILCNGFKPPNSAYATEIIQLKRDHDSVIPIIEDIQEFEPLIDSGLSFDVGLRQKSYGHHQDLAEMDRANSRFGMNIDDVFKAAEIAHNSDSLNLRLYHAMVGSQIVDIDSFIDRLQPPIEIFAQLRQKYPELSIFDFGGGVPIAMTLDFKCDYLAFALKLLSTIKATCEKYQVQVPDIIGEFGRYTVTEHGAHLFKIISVKDNGSQFPWYIMDGSIMSSFPDSWALGEHFTVLPLNHLDQPFQQVQLGGITCDSDDIFPPHKSTSPLYLPVETNDLYIGFFGIGAYQEMLGGAGGSKHCVIPEADELIIDRDQAGNYQFELIQGQGPRAVLGNLGYYPRGKQKL
jgi:arginine decarboxylase